MYTYYILDTHGDREREERERLRGRREEKFYMPGVMDHKIPVPGVHLLKSCWSVCSRDILNNEDSCYMFYLCSLALLKHYQ